LYQAQGRQSSVAYTSDEFQFQFFNQEMGNDTADHSNTGEATHNKPTFSVHSRANFDNRSAVHVPRAWQGFITIDVFP